MATKKQLQKKYADDLAASTAPTALLQALYALSNDKTLEGADLITYDGWKGKRPSGRQIAKAKELLGLKKKAQVKKASNGRKKKAASSPGTIRRVNMVIDDVVWEVAVEARTQRLENELAKLKELTAEAN